MNALKTLTKLELRRTLSQATDLIKTTEEQLSATLKEAEETLRNVRSITDNVNGITNDVSAFSSSISAFGSSISNVAGNIKNITHKMEDTATAASGNVSGFKYGLKAAFRVFANNLSRKRRH